MRCHVTARAESHNASAMRFIIVLQIVRYSPHKFLNLLLTTEKNYE